MPEMLCYIRMHPAVSVCRTSLSSGKAPVTEAVVVENQPLDTISRRLNGCFAEPLGQCCYGGLGIGVGVGPIAANIRAAMTVPSSWLLKTDSLGAVSDPANAGRVSPRHLAGDDCRAGRCTVTLPPHSTATIEFAANGADRD